MASLRLSQSWLPPLKCVCHSPHYSLVPHTCLLHSLTRCGQPCRGQDFPLMMALRSLTSNHLLLFFSVVFLSLRFLPLAVAICAMSRKPVRVEALRNKTSTEGKDMSPGTRPSGFRYCVSLESWKVAKTPSSTLGVSVFLSIKWE